MRAHVDPLTHTLLGGSLGYALFHRSLGRTAAGVAALAAFAPDADVFIRSSTDPLLAVEFHRHFTHALLFAPVGAALVTSLFLLRPANRSRFLLLWLCATVAYLSHSLLDAATSYGTQLLWPISNHRFGWDFVSVVDLLVTIPLAIGLLLALKRRQPRPALVALVLAIGYIGFGAVQHARASAAQRALAATRGHHLERAEVMPTLANNLVWRTLYVHEGRIHADRIRVGWFSGATIRQGWSLPLTELADLTPAEAARNQRRSFQRFAWFSEHWVARSPSDASVLGDMRYSLSDEAFDPIWGIRFTDTNAPAEVVWVNRSRDRRVAPGQLWAEIVGRDSRFRPVALVAPPALDR